MSAGSLDAAAASLRACFGGRDVIRWGTQARVPYPRSPLPATKRRPTMRTSTALFLHDGFMDRYSGDRLVFPGVLRLLSHLFPADFPYHPNWKFGLGHPWYWDLYPPSSWPVSRRIVRWRDVGDPAPMLGIPLKTRRFANVSGWCPPASGSEESWFEPRRGNSKAGKRLRRFRPLSLSGGGSV